MFGLHGAIFDVDTYWEKLTPFKNYSPPAKEYYCTSRLLCTLFGGHMLYEQVNVYKVIQKCFVCSNNSHFSKEKKKCVCEQGFGLKKWRCTNKSDLK